MSETLIITQEEKDFLDASIRRVPDFPRPGILFYDITSILTKPDAFKFCIDLILRIVIVALERRVIFQPCKYLEILSSSTLIFSQIFKKRFLTLSFSSSSQLKLSYALLK